MLTKTLAHKLRCPYCGYRSNRVIKHPSEQTNAVAVPQWGPKSRQDAPAACREAICGAFEAEM